MNGVKIQAEDFDWEDETLQPLDASIESDLVKVQMQIVRAATSGRDIYASMPAGRGRDSGYVVPIRMERDTTRCTTVVISPFRALNKEYASSVERRGVSTLCFDAKTDVASKYRIAQDITQGRGAPALIYMTPDFVMSSEIAADILDHLYRVSSLKRIVFDNAGMICQVARESPYNRIELSQLRQIYPGTPIMCITETPSRRCKEKVFEMLGLKADDVDVFYAPLDFPNLCYSVVEEEDKINDMIQRILTDFDGQSGIIYCLTRKEAEDIATRLQFCEISADYYHAERNDREDLKDAWVEGSLKVIVGTSAFCTGNRKDVRFVFHHSIPPSFETYFRQLGKAGRDGEPATSVLYYNEGDKERLRYLIQTGTMDKDEDVGYREVQRDLPRSLQNRALKTHEVQKVQNGKSINFQINRFMQMVRYANEQVKCRREMIINHYGQEFDPKQCSGQCDNCMRMSSTISRIAVEEVDVTKYASYALRLISDSTQFERRITKREAIECLAGINSNTLRRKRLLELRSYGSMQTKSFQTIEKILTALETRYIIGYFPLKEPKDGDYLHVRVISGSLSLAVHEGRYRIKLPSFQVYDRQDLEEEFFDLDEDDVAEEVDAALYWTKEADDPNESSATMSEASSLRIVPPMPGPSFLMIKEEQISEDELCHDDEEPQPILRPGKRSTDDSSNSSMKKRRKLQCRR